MSKKWIPISLGVLLLLVIVFNVVSKQASKSPFGEKEVVETLPPKETAEIKVRRDSANVEVETRPTIGTTEAVINQDGETGIVGITETLEDGSYIGIAPNGDVMATLNTPKLSSGHVYSENEAVALENLIYYWSEHNVSNEVLQDKLNSKTYEGLSEQDRTEIFNSITEKSPHNNPTETTASIPETTVQSERDKEAVDKMRKEIEDSFVN